MSTNKNVVSTTKSVLQSLNKEVKTSEIYEVYSQICGYKGWQVASAMEVEFSPSVQLKLKEKLLNKINQMAPSLDKLVSQYLLDEDGELFKSEFEKLEVSQEQMSEFLERLINLNQSLSFYAKFLEILVDHEPFATGIMNNPKFLKVLHEIYDVKNKEKELQEKIKEIETPFKPETNHQIKSKFGVFVVEESETAYSSNDGFDSLAAVELCLNNDSKLNSFLKGISQSEIQCFLSKPKVDHSKILSSPEILMVLKEKGIRFINNQGEVWVSGESPFVKINEIVLKHYNEENLIVWTQSLLKVGEAYKVEGVRPRENKEDNFIFIINRTKPNGEIKSFTISPQFISLSNLE